jgi:hypothetical protein
MSKKWDKYRAIKLFPEIYNDLKRACNKHPMRPSVQKMANHLLRFAIEQEKAKP